MRDESWSWPGTGRHRRAWGLVESSQLGARAGTKRVLTAVLTKTVLAKNKRLLTWSGTRFHRFQTSRCCLDMACRRGHAGKPDDAITPRVHAWKALEWQGLVCHWIPRALLRTIYTGCCFCHQIFVAFCITIWHMGGQLVPCRNATPSYMLELVPPTQIFQH